MRVRTPVIASFLIPLALFASACSSSSPDKGTDSSSPVTGSDSGGDGGGKVSDDALKLTQCLREQGIDIPDPKPGQDPRGLTLGKDVDPAQFQKAMAACGRDTSSGSGAGDSDQKAQDAAVKMAQCMRGKGYDMPDPKLVDGNMPANKIPDGVDKDTYMKDANDCSKDAAK